MTVLKMFDVAENCNENKNVQMKVLNLTAPLVVLELFNFVLYKDNNSTIIGLKNMGTVLIGICY